MDLQDYRRELDRIDSELTHLFAERMALSGQIAAHKRERGLAVHDPSREAERFAAAEAGMPEALFGYGTALYASVLELSRARQERALETLPGNIVLIGMPGSGKTTIAGELGRRLGRPCVGSDALVEALTGRRIPELFAELGEDAFRALETRALALLCARGGGIIDTGGGCVARKENIPLLRLCGTAVWIKRDLDALERRGRPLSLARDPRELYAEREPLYRRCAQLAIENNGTVDEAVEQIIRAFQDK